MKVRKIGRNDYCPCGSGKKYKVCHISAHKRKSYEPWDVDKILKDSKAFEYCSCPSFMHKDCTKKIIDAHTVSKSSTLKPISKNNKVYGTIYNIFDLNDSNGNPSPKEIPIIRASTFNGFCSFHDNMIFKEIDDNKFSGSNKQIFLLAFRSWARENFGKKYQRKVLQNTKKMDYGKSQKVQTKIRDTRNDFETGLNLSETDNTIQISNIEDIFKADNYSNCKGFVIEFESLLPIVCSGGFQPQYDFFGNEIQDILQNEELSLLYFSIHVSKGISYAVFSWFDKINEAPEKLIDSLIEYEDNKIFSALMRLIFQNIENTYFSIDWWDSLSENLKNTSIERINRGNMPFTPINKYCLVENNEEYGEYSIKTKYKVNW